MCQNGVGSQRYVSKVVVVLMISASWLWTQMLIVVAMLVVLVAMVAMVVCPVSSVQVAAVAGTRPHIPHSRQGSSVPQHQTSLAGNMECVSTPGTCWSWTFDIVRCSESRGQSAGVTGDLWSIGSEEREREGAGSEEGLGQSCLYTCLTSDLLPVCIPAPLADTRFMTF